MGKILTVQYDPLNGTVFPDGVAMEEAENVVRDFHQLDVEKQLVVIGSELSVQCFRLLVKRGEIQHSQIQFESNGEIIPVNVQGRLPNWPSHFCRYFLQYLMELCKTD